jgi:hypothetical protein
MKCVYCNNEFQQKSIINKYCSKKCKSKVEAQNRSKKPAIKVCKCCNKEFTPYTSLDKFCSANCRIENMKSKRTRRWNKESTEKRTGINNPAFKSGMYTRASSRTDEGQKLYLRNRNELRSDMLLKYGYLFCERCNTNQTYKWEMHHVIYRSEKPLHEHLHNKRNLMNLCIKCHNWFHKNKSNRNEIVEERKLYELFGEDVRNKLK